MGGSHRLENYRSITSLHLHEIDREINTLVLESYIIDIPENNTHEETPHVCQHISVMQLKSLGLGLTTHVFPRIKYNSASSECSNSYKRGGAENSIDLWIDQSKIMKTMSMIFSHMDVTRSRELKPPADQK